jgi:hypothetical protein
MLKDSQLLQRVLAHLAETFAPDPRTAVFLRSAGASTKCGQGGCALSAASGRTFDPEGRGWIASRPWPLVHHRTSAQGRVARRHDDWPGGMPNAERFRGSRPSRIYAPTGAAAGFFAPARARRVPERLLRHVPARARVHEGSKGSRRGVAASENSGLDLACNNGRKQRDRSTCPGVEQPRRQGP